MADVKAIATKIERELKGLASVVIESPDVISVEAPPGVIREVAEKLAGLGFDHVKCVTGVDEPSEDKIKVVYHVASFDPELARVIVAMRTAVKREDPALPSLTSVWESAEYFERETYDLLGVKFAGHPRLERLLLPPDYTGIPPLRKDFKLKEARLTVE